jgi:3D (Asp-Asp-Asp) domain-containing protein
MASFDTTLYTNQNGSAGASPATGYPLAKDSAGKVRYATVEYTLAGTEAATDTINLATLKVGAKVIPHLSEVYVENPGTALVFDIGDAGDADRYVDGLTVSAGGFFRWSEGGTAAATANSLYEIASGNEDIVLTVGTATSLTADQDLLFLIAYVDE